jgi:adenylosuccinate synthase
MRTADLWEHTSATWVNMSPPGPFELDGADDVIIEGTQGYGLGLHTAFYPQVTSSDCRAIDFLAMAGISPWAEDVRLDVLLVARVFPIRVAGNSGPLRGETSWSDLDLPEERTTVTNKVRRVGQWDEALVMEALVANGGGDFHPDVKVALTMLDQLHPEMRDETTLLPASEAYVADLEDKLGTYIPLVGTSPTTVVER